MKNLFLFFSIVCYISTWGCSSGIESISLKSTSWQLDSLAGINIIPSGKTVTLEFNSNTKISGFGGCNKYGGSYKAGSKSITVVNLYSTDMACDKSQTETAFFNALKKADSYTVSGGRLMFYEQGALTIVLNEIK